MKRLLLLTFILCLVLPCFGCDQGDLPPAGDGTTDGTTTGETSGGEDFNFTSSFVEEVIAVDQYGSVNKISVGMNGNHLWTLYPMMSGWPRTCFVSDLNDAPALVSIENNVVTQIELFESRTHLPSSEDLQKIKKGMTLSQVTALVGLPYEAEENLSVGGDIYRAWNGDVCVVDFGYEGENDNNVLHVIDVRFQQNGDAVAVQKLPAKSIDVETHRFAKAAAIHGENGTQLIDLELPIDAFYAQCPNQKRLMGFFVCDAAGNYCSILQFEDSKLKQIETFEINKLELDKEDYDQIVVGMTLSKVVSLVGVPDAVEEMGTYGYRAAVYEHEGVRYVLQFTQRNTEEGGYHLVVSGVLKSSAVR